MLKNANANSLFSRRSHYTLVYQKSIEITHYLKYFFTFKGIPALNLTYLIF
jgi:hypothetical protein